MDPTKAMSGKHEMDYATENAILDSRMASLKNKIQSKADENDKHRQEIMELKKYVLTLSEKLAMEEAQEEVIKKYIERHKSTKLTLDQLHTTLQTQFQTIKLKRDEINQRNINLIEEFTQKWEKYEAMYKTLPLVEQRDKLMVETKQLEIQVAECDLKCQQEKQKVSQFRRITEERRLQAFVQLAQTFINYRDKVNSIKALEKSNREKEIEIEKLLAEKEVLLKEMASNTQDAVARALERSGKTKVGISSLSQGSSFRRQSAGGSPCGVLSHLQHAPLSLRQPLSSTPINTESRYLVHRSQPELSYELMDLQNSNASPAPRVSVGPRPGAVSAPILDKPPTENEILSRPASAVDQRLRSNTPHHMPTRHEDRGSVLSLNMESERQSVEEPKATEMSWMQTSKEIDQPRYSAIRGRPTRATYHTSTSAAMNPPYLAPPAAPRASSANSQSQEDMFVEEIVPQSKRIRQEHTPVENEWAKVPEPERRPEIRPVVPYQTESSEVSESSQETEEEHSQTSDTLTLSPRNIMNENTHQQYLMRMDSSNSDYLFKTGNVSNPPPDMTRPRDYADEITTVSEYSSVPSPEFNVNLSPPRSSIEQSGQAETASPTYNFSSALSPIGPNTLFNLGPQQGTRSASPDFNSFFKSNSDNKGQDKSVSDFFTLFG